MLCHFSKYMNGRGSLKVGSNLVDSAHSYLCHTVNRPAVNPQVEQMIQGKQQVTTKGWLKNTRSVMDHSSSTALLKSLCKVGIKTSTT